MAKFKALPVEPRLWAQIDKNGPAPDFRPELGPCWLWTGCLDTKGYGQIRINGRMELVHKVVWKILRGSFPEGLEQDHLCRVPRCANPDHFEWVTHQENCRRSAWGLRTHCAKGHAFTDENTVLRRRHRGRMIRTCLECEREHLRSQRRKARVA